MATMTADERAALAAIDEESLRTLNQALVQTLVEQFTPEQLATMIVQTLRHHTAR